MSRKEERLDFELEKKGEYQQPMESESDLKSFRERPKFVLSRDEELTFFRLNPDTGYFDIKRQFQIGYSDFNKQLFSMFRNVVMFWLVVTYSGLFSLLFCVGLYCFVFESIPHDHGPGESSMLVVMFILLFWLLSFILFCVGTVYRFWLNRKLPEFKTFVQFNDNTRRLEVLGEDGKEVKSVEFDEMKDFVLVEKVKLTWKESMMSVFYGRPMALVCVLEGEGRKVVVEPKLLFQNEVLGKNSLVFELLQKFSGDKDSGVLICRKKLMLDMKKIMRTRC